MSLLSERKRAQGIQLTPTIHETILVDESATTADIYNELSMKLSQVRGTIALLTLIDAEDFANVPDGALAQAAWAIDEQMEAVGTLADLIYHRHSDTARSQQS